MRKQFMLSMGAAVLAGAVGGALLSPAPLGAVAKEIVELLAGVNQLQQGQRDMQSSIDTKMTEMRTLVQQETDNSNKLNASINGMTKTLQDMQANNSTQLSAASSSVEGVSSNVTELQGRLTKMSQQLADLQNALQGIDAKVTALSQPANPTGGQAVVTPGAPGNMPATDPGMNPAATAPAPLTMAPIVNTPPSGNAGRAPAGSSAPSGETLYNNALNDVLTRKYDLAKQEFRDYLKYYPTGPYVSNAYYYLGEVDRTEQHYDEAIDNYTIVISKYPDSFKLPSAYFQRGVAYLAINKKTQGIADLRAVVRRFPHTEEEGSARDRLKALGVPVTPGGRD
jgi:tol-pal system protein YbgF